MDLKTSGLLEYDCLPHVLEGIVEKPIVPEITTIDEDGKIKVIKKAEPARITSCKSLDDEEVIFRAMIEAEFAAHAELANKKAKFSHITDVTGVVAGHKAYFITDCMVKLDHTDFWKKNSYFYSEDGKVKAKKIIVRLLDKAKKAATAEEVRAVRMDYNACSPDLRAILRCNIFDKVTYDDSVDGLISKRESEFGIKRTNKHSDFSSKESLRERESSYVYDKDKLGQATGGKNGQPVINVSKELPTGKTKVGKRIILDLGTDKEIEITEKSAPKTWELLCKWFLDTYGRSTFTESSDHVKFVTGYRSIKFYNALSYGEFYKVGTLKNKLEKYNKEEK